MTITAPSPGIDAPEVIDPALEADIVKFERFTSEYLAGDLDEDVFRVFRLTNGIYGQRQGEQNQMLRVRIPYGSIRADQLEMIADLVDEYSRGWAHITTRQNLQFHYVQLPLVGEVMRKLATVGLMTREACGDTVRNVQGCHLAGACPFEVLDITAWADATNEHFLRNPIAQRMPRKFKINFSGCETDCGQAMFNDVGVIATARRNDDGSVEPGFRIYIAGGLGTSPHPALVLEDFTAREDLLPTIESVLRVFDSAGNRDNKLRARMKWLVDSLGIEEVRRRVFATRHLLPASSSWPGGIPESVLRLGDAPAGRAVNGEVTAVGQGVAVQIGAANGFAKWDQVNVIRGAAKGTVSAYAHAPLGDITSAQFRGLAALQREVGADVRLTNRQNLVFRDLQEMDLPLVYERFESLGMAAPGAELVRDVVSCPGADTCNLAVTQSRGLASAIEDELVAQGLAETHGVRINISGCPNSCGQHHAADIGLHGLERRVNGTVAPGYQLLLGGYVGQEQIHFGDRALRLPAKSAAKAVAAIVARYSNEREPAEKFRSWLDRSGGAKSVKSWLGEYDSFPTPEQDPSFYIDYDETGPYSVEVGESECAT